MTHATAVAMRAEMTVALSSCKSVAPSQANNRIKPVSRAWASVLASASYCIAIRTWNTATIAKSASPNSVRDATTAAVRSSTRMPMASKMT